MKRKLFSLAAAVCMAGTCCGAFQTAASTTEENLKDIYAWWRSCALPDDGMLQMYADECVSGAYPTDGYFIATQFQNSGQDYRYDSDLFIEDGYLMQLYAIVPGGDSAMFYTKSEADIDAAAAVLTAHYPEQAQRYFRNKQTCFRLTDRNTDTLHAVEKELTDDGLITCFYYNVPVYEQWTFTVPYLTGYSESQFYSPTFQGKLTADILRDYLVEKDLSCKVRTRTGASGKVFYVVPDEKLTFRAHWELALQLYHELGIVPEMSNLLLEVQEEYTLPKGAGVPYDVNTDTVLDAKDAAAVSHYLLYADPVWDPEAGDMNADGKYSAADLTLIKRVLLAAGQPTEKALPEPPVRALNPSLPSVGTDQIPVFAVEFPDCTFPISGIANLLNNRIFDKTYWEKGQYPFDSVSAYLSRSSYGRLRLTGNVFQYTAEHPISWYADDDAKSLVDEILTDYDAMLDYRNYDADKNSILDSLVIVLPEAALKIDSDGDKKPDWWPFSIDAYSQKTYDGVRAGQFCVIPYEGLYSEEFVSKAAHELCHAMGLPDYYQPATETTSDKDGLGGEAGTELMDEGGGDLSACSKLLLGWLAEDEIQIYTGGTQTFLLKPSQNAPSCIMIPKDPETGFLSEYFLIEYVEQSGNQLNSPGSGIRILHVDAAVSEGDFGPELTYHNHGKNYDRSHQKQRVLRLVNRNGYFYPGDRDKEYIGYTDTIDGSTEGFRWYDENGDLRLDPGLTVRIDDLHAGPFENPDSPDPAAWLSGIAQITISETE